MKCLTREECARYVRGLGFGIGDQRMAKSRGLRDGVSARLRIPDSSGGQRALVDRVLELYGTSKDLMFWVCQRGASWSDEYAEVLHQIRMAEGEDRLLVDAPCHLFSENEEGLARGVMLLVLALRWNACLAREGIFCLLSLRKGDRMTIAARDHATISGIVSKLENGGFILERKPSCQSRE
jgi:hypothetical protein